MARTASEILNAIDEALAAEDAGMPLPPEDAPVRGVPTLHTLPRGGALSADDESDDDASEFGRVSHCHRCGIETGINAGDWCAPCWSASWHDALFERRRWI